MELGKVRIGRVVDGPYVLEFRFLETAGPTLIPETFQTSGSKEALEELNAGVQTALDALHLAGIEPGQLRVTEITYWPGIITRVYFTGSLLATFRAWQPELNASPFLTTVTDFTSQELEKKFPKDEFNFPRNKLTFS